MANEFQMHAYSWNRICKMVGFEHVFPKLRCIPYSFVPYLDAIWNKLPTILKLSESFQFYFNMPLKLTNDSICNITNYIFVNFAEPRISYRKQLLFRPYSYSMKVFYVRYKRRVGGGKLHFVWGTKQFLPKLIGIITISPPGMLREYYQIFEISVKPLLNPKKLYRFGSLKSSRPLTSFFLWNLRGSIIFFWTELYYVFRIEEKREVQISLEES
jgi:hypothetical protein